MLKHFWIIPVLLLVLSILPADAYTVVLKNGKVMKGTLISESEEKITFKDEQGLQFSLKKSALDLEKMKEANLPPPPPAAPAAQPAETRTTAPAAKKPVRTYTTADLEALRDKVKLSTSSGNAGEMIDTSNPASYYRGLMEAVSRITGVMNDLGGLLDGMNTDWEVAASTGREPVASLGKYKTGKAFTDITQGIKANLSELEALRVSMQPAPKGFERAYDAFNRSVDALYTYFTAVQGYNGNPPVQAFRSSLEKYSNTVDAGLAEIQSVPAPADVQPPETSPNTEPPQ